MSDRETTTVLSSTAIDSVTAIDNVTALGVTTVADETVTEHENIAASVHNKIFKKRATNKSDQQRLVALTIHLSDIFKDLQNTVIKDNKDAMNLIQRLIISEHRRALSRNAKLYRMCIKSKFQEMREEFRNGLLAISRVIPTIFEKVELPLGVLSPVADSPISPSSEFHDNNAPIARREDNDDVRTMVIPTGRNDDCNRSMDAIIEEISTRTALTAKQRKAATLRTLRNRYRTMMRNISEYMRQRPLFRAINITVSKTRLKLRQRFRQELHRRREDEQQRRRCEESGVSSHEDNDRRAKESSKRSILPCDDNNEESCCRTAKHVRPTYECDDARINEDDVARSAINISDIETYRNPKTSDFANKSDDNENDDDDSGDDDDNDDNNDNESDATNIDNINSNSTTDSDGHDNGHVREIVSRDGEQNQTEIQCKARNAASLTGETTSIDDATKELDRILNFYNHPPNSVETAMVEQICCNTFDETLLPIINKTQASTSSATMDNEKNIPAVSTLSAIALPVRCDDLSKTVSNGMRIAYSIISDEEIELQACRSVTCNFDGDNDDDELNMAAKIYEMREMISRSQLTTPSYIAALGEIEYALIRSPRHSIFTYNGEKVVVHYPKTNKTVSCRALYEKIINLSTRLPQFTVTAFVNVRNRKIVIVDSTLNNKQQRRFESVMKLHYKIVKWHRGTYEFSTNEDTVVRYAGRVYIVPRSPEIIVGINGIIQSKNGVMYTIVSLRGNSFIQCGTVPKVDGEKLDKLKRVDGRIIPNGYEFIKPLRHVKITYDDFDGRHFHNARILEVTNEPITQITEFWPHSKAVSKPSEQARTSVKKI